MISDDVRAEALAHAQQEYPRESCGLVVLRHGRLKYFPCKNIAEKAAHFVLDPLDYVRAEDSGDVVGIIHSHPNVGPQPSQADLVSCELSGLPWYIVAVPIGNWETVTPKGYKAPLIGREYSYGILDCYTVIQDFYRDELGISLPHFERVEEFWKKGFSQYLDNFQAAGFVKHDGQIQRGDIILMQVGAKTVNHAAVYLGNDKILHHLSNQLSTRDIYGGYWRKCTRLVVRYMGNSSGG